MDLIRQQDVTAGLYPVKTQDLAKRVDKALTQITEVAPIFRTWNRSHSDMTWNAMNLDHESETRNLREIGASIQRRRDALTEVHFAYKECLANAEVHEEQAVEYEQDGKKALADRERLLAQKERAYAQMKHEAILGATKDINILKSSYDKIMGRIVEKHGKFDEEVFEAEEKEYWIRRLFVQAMRDVREVGKIRVGAQRDLEQLGIEPQEAMHDINLYLLNIKDTFGRKMEALSMMKSKGMNTSEFENTPFIEREMRDEWAERMAKKYTPALTKKLERMGADTSHLYRLEVSNDS